MENMRIFVSLLFLTFSIVAISTGCIKEKDKNGFYNTPDSRATAIQVSSNIQERQLEETNKQLKRIADALEKQNGK